LESSARQLDRVGNPATERFGATVAEAKTGASPEFELPKALTHLPH